MSDKFEFSVDTMLRCSGNTTADLEYAAYFCRSAVQKSAEATSTLQSMVDLSYWSKDVFSEAESAYALVMGLHEKVIYMQSFFSRKSHMLDLFDKAFLDLRQHVQSAQKSMKELDHWRPRRR